MRLSQAFNFRLVSSELWEKRLELALVKAIEHCPHWLRRSLISIGSGIVELFLQLVAGGDNEPRLARNAAARPENSFCMQQVVERLVDGALGNLAHNHCREGPLQTR